MSLLFAVLLSLSAQAETYDFQFSEESSAAEKSIPAATVAEEIPGRLRLTAGGFYLNRGRYKKEEGSLEFEPGLESGGGMVELAWYLRPGLALNAFLGTYSLAQGARPTYLGVELELIPLRTSRFEGAVLLGGSTLTGPGPAVHGGFRVVYGLSKEWSLALAGRANTHYVAGETGLCLRFF